MNELTIYRPTNVTLLSLVGVFQICRSLLHLLYTFNHSV